MTIPRHQAMAARRAVAGPVLTLDLQLSGALADRLKAEAADRGTTPRELAGEILETVVKHDLFKAVLDP